MSLMPTPRDKRQVLPDAMVMAGVDARAIAAHAVRHHGRRRRQRRLQPLAHDEAPQCRNGAENVDPEPAQQVRPAATQSSTSG